MYEYLIFTHTLQLGRGGKDGLDFKGPNTHSTGLDQAHAEGRASG